MMGAQYIPLTIDPSDEKRSSSEASYLQYALASGRTNLQVFTKTLAKKIVFDGETATGIIVMNKNGTASTLVAKKEVILSAGAVS
jgi:choline dehydrogenase